MKKRLLRLAGLCVGVSLWMYPTVSADAAEDDEGIRAGASGRFQPGIEIGASYDSNVYRSESNGEGDLVLRVEPHLRYILRSENADFEVYGEYHLKQYTGVAVDHQNDSVGHKDLNVYANYLAGLDLVTRPKGQFSFLFGDKLSRLSREFDNVDLPQFRYSLMDSLNNKAHIGVEGRPGTSLRIRGTFNIDLARYTGANAQGFGESSDRRLYGQAFDFYGNIEVGWKFFPKTQAMLIADFGHIMWEPDLQDSFTVAGCDESLCSMNQYDSDHWRVWLGVQGKISRKLALQGLFGYGNAYFPNSSEGVGGNLRGADGILGKVQLHWNPALTQKITIGFLRDYRFLYFSNYYITTSPYVRYRGQIAGFILPTAEFKYLYRTIAGDVDRTDHEIKARAGVDFQIRDFFSVGVDYTYWSIVASSDGSEPTFSDHMIGLTIELGY